MTDERIALQARVLSAWEVADLEQKDEIVRRAAGMKAVPVERGKTWYEVRCGKCRATFAIDARTFNKIIDRFGYIYCANAFCGIPLYAMPHEDVLDRVARRARS